MTESTITGTSRLGSMREPSCGYVTEPYGGFTSLDSFGSKLSYLGAFNPAASVFPAVQECSLYTPYGTANDGEAFGLRALVYQAPIAFSYACTFDAAGLSTDVVCMIAVFLQSGWTLAGNTLQLQGSRDGAAWDTVVDEVRVLTRPSATLIPIWPPVGYRYWRIYGVVNDTRTGLFYFDGLDMFFVMLWSGVAPGGPAFLRGHVTYAAEMAGGR